jgi:hypothetical protein
VEDCIKKRIRWAGRVAQMGDMRSANKILVGGPEGKRPVGTSRPGWEDNIRMDLREIRWEGVDWMRLAQNSDQWRPVVNTVMNLRVP